MKKTVIIMGLIIAAIALWFTLGQQIFVWGTDITKLNNSGELTPITEVMFYNDESHDNTINSSKLSKYSRLGDKLYVFKSEFITGPIYDSSSVKHNKYISVLGEESKRIDVSGSEEQVWCYGGQLYVVKHQFSEAVLFRMDTDGAYEVELGQIARAGVDSGSATNTRVTFGGGNAYAYSDYSYKFFSYEYNKLPQLHIFKKPLDGSKGKNIVTASDLGGFFANAKCYGGNLFFTYYTKEYADKKVLINSTGLYCYDSKKDKVVRLLSDNISDYVIDIKENSLYCFVVNEGVYRYDFATGEKNLFYEAKKDVEVSNIMMDENYIYLDNTQGALREGIAYNTFVIIDRRTGLLVDVIDHSGEVYYCDEIFIEK